MSRRRKAILDSCAQLATMEECTKELAEAVVAILVQAGPQPRRIKPDTPQQAFFSTVSTRRHQRAVRAARLMAASMNPPNQNNDNANRDQ